MDGLEPRLGCGFGGVLGFFAVADQQLQPGSGRLTADLLVGRGADPAQLQHIAQQRIPPLGGILPEHGQRSLHAVGVGVVAVLDHIHALAVDDPLAHSGLLEVGQPCNDAFGVKAKAGGGGISRQRVGHVVPAHRRDAHREAARVPIHESEGHAVALRMDVLCADIRVCIAEAEPDRPDRTGQSRFPQEGIVAVQHQRGTFGQTGADLELGLADVLLTAEVADVGYADAGDDADIRPGTLGQPLDLPQMAHAHLDHRIRGVFPDVEEGAGQTQLVVLVALGLDGAAKARNGSVGHLLGGGLADAAGHAHDLGRKLAAVVRAHGHHGAVAVRAEDGLLRRHPLHRVVQHHIGCPLFQCFGRKIVAIEFFSGEGHKNAARPHLAAVGGHKIEGSVGGKPLCRQPLE